MANIDLPQRFKPKFEADQDLDGIVKPTLPTFLPGMISSFQCSAQSKSIDDL